MKVVTEIKIFGFTICSTYQETLEETWKRVVRGFEKTLFSWESRQLETLGQRVQVASTFALSKLYYVAQVLPLPDKHRKVVERRISSFIFRGRHERLKLGELENMSENGGLGLPNLSVKADALLMKQLCRMLSLPNEDTYRLVGYWLGSFLQDTGLGEDFPHLAEVGPVSHLMSRSFPLHQDMLDTFLESVGRGEIKNSNTQEVTTKEIYKSRMSSLLTPPKIETKFPLVNFPKLVYPRYNHAVLEAKQGDIMFAMIHGIYKNRQRLFQQDRTDDPLCTNQACKNSNLAHSVEHIFCGCFRVRTAWLWVRQKLLVLWGDQGPLTAPTNQEIIMLMYPKVTQEAETIFLLGIFMELVDREVVGKHKELLVGTVKGVFQAKVSQIASRAAPELHFPQGWLQGGGLG